MTRSSHSQWSAIGHDDAIGAEERAPHIGALQADGAPGAVRNGAQGELALALSPQLLDGDDLTVDVDGGVGLVAPSEGKAFRRGVTSKGLIRDPVFELALELPGDESPGEEKRDSDDIGGHDGPFLLVQPECCSQVARVRAFLMHTRRGLGRQVKIFSSPAKISSRVCLLVKVRFQTRICSTCQ